MYVRYSFPFTLSPSFLRKGSPTPQQASSFHQELSANTRFAGGSHKVIFGASLCKGSEVENGGNTFLIPAQKRYNLDSDTSKLFWRK